VSQRLGECISRQRRQDAECTGRLEDAVGDQRMNMRIEGDQVAEGLHVIFAPGEAFQFDWSEDWIRIGAKKTKLQMAHFKLCHSRVFFLRAYLLQTHEMLFDAHNHAFRVLGGVPERGIYDNMKTPAVISKILNHLQEQSPLDSGVLIPNPRAPPQARLFG